MPNHMHGIIVLNHLEVSLADTPDSSPLTDTSVRVSLADTPDTSPLTDTSVRVSLSDTPIPQIICLIKGQGLALPLRFSILWVHTNHWLQMDVWVFTNQKTKQWANFGNAITTNILFATNNLIKTFQIIL
jgi:hypothetical protein